jgi:two-component system OmpR family sensor kinase
MRRSLQWRLSLLLGSAILLAALVAAAISFLVAYHEATEFQDDMLQQIAVLAAHASGGLGQIGAPGELPGKEALDSAES